VHVYVSFAYFPKFDWLGGSSCMVHSEPVPNPPAFRELVALQPVMNAGKVRNLTEVMAEIDPVRNNIPFEFALVNIKQSYCTPA